MNTNVRKTIGQAALALVATFAVAATVPEANAQGGVPFSDANWISMGGFPGANGAVYAAVVDGSGNLYIGGDFTIVGDVVANGVAKWNGSNWSPLGSGVSYGGNAFSVRALAVSGSDVYAGGEFRTAGGTAANYIAKWNGSSWSALGSGIGGGGGGPSVFALAVSGTDLYAGGAFTTAGGNPAGFVAKWDGSSWSALGAGMDNWVYALAVSGGNVFAGGLFTAAGGSAATNIAKWDGSSWSALGSGMSSRAFLSPSYVSALAVSGSDLYAGGFFRTAGGVAATNIAKWNGISWSGHGAGTSGNAVYALAVSGTDIYAGGELHAAFGNAINYIAKWNGSSWSALGSGVNTIVWALAASGSEVYAGGRFTRAGDGVANYIAKWNGNSWSALGSGMSYRGNPYPVRALGVSGTDLYVPGAFRTVGGNEVTYIAKWNGSSWSARGSGLDGSVSALAVSGTDVYAGGWFTTADGSAANHIAKWNGTSWSALGTGIGGSDQGVGPVVNALAASGNDLYAGGIFRTAGGSPATNIAKWNGSNWAALGSGLAGTFPGVSALAVSGNDVYAGGAFTMADGTAVNYIARWNGSNWAALGSGMNGGVAALTVSGSDLYAGGYFTTAGGVSANYVAKWNGSDWSALGSGMDNQVYALAVSGNDLYAGGYFTNVGGIAAAKIAKWNGSSWSALGSGMNRNVYALAVSGSELYAGGDFTTAGGKVSAYIARAYLLPLPALSVRRADSNVIVSWPSVNTAGFGLEQTGGLGPTPSWVTNSASVADDGTNKSVTLRATNRAQFFRLRRP